jgi:hypothetical protein
MIAVSEARAVLGRTPATLDALLRGLPDAWLLATEGDSTWSPFDVVGHLIHGERTDWIPRLRIILEHGEARPFVPFDRFAQERESQGKSIVELLDTFASLRAENLRVLEELPAGPDVLSRTGTHPELGRVTLGQLLATWVAHDLDHVVQVARVMAKRYRDEVGPWTAYLSVLQR